MKVFITGGTGFIGSEVVKELIGAGHQVVGLVRSEASAEKLIRRGARAMLGSITDLEILQYGAKQSDAVIHCGFIHNFADFMSSVQIDKQAIEAIGTALAGTGKTFIVTSGVPTGEPGHVVTENDEPDSSFPRQSEQTALPYADKGVKVIIVRPSRIVHGKGNFGFISMLTAIARNKRVSAYVDYGRHAFHSVHVLDMAKLYLLALDKGENGHRYQGVADFSIPYLQVAEFIGEKLEVPVISIHEDDVPAHFGFYGQVPGSDNPASSEITQAALGWKPTQLSLMEDLEENFRFAS